MSVIWVSLITCLKMPLCAMRPWVNTHLAICGERRRTKQQKKNKKKQTTLLCLPFTISIDGRVREGSCTHTPTQSMISVRHFVSLMHALNARRSDVNFRLYVLSSLSSSSSLSSPIQNVCRSFAGVSVDCICCATYRWCTWSIVLVLIHPLPAYDDINCVLILPYYYLFIADDIVHCSTISVGFGRLLLCLCSSHSRFSFLLSFLAYVWHLDRPLNTVLFERKGKRQTSKEKTKSKKK